MSIERTALGGGQSRKFTGMAGVDADARLLADPSVLRARFADPSFTPAVSPLVAGELHRLANLPRVQRTDVVALFERDQLLAGRLIGDTAGGMRPTPRTPTDVLKEPGLTELHRRIAHLSQRVRVRRTGPFDALFDSVANHNAAVGRIARLIALQTSIPAPYAWLCGLLHDAGITAFLSMIAERGAQLPLEPEALMSILDGRHESAIAELVASWRLPADLGLAVSRHHNPFMDGYAHPMAIILCIADRLAAVHGHPVRPGLGATGGMDGTSSEMVDRARRALGLPDAVWHSVQREAPAALVGLGQDVSRTS